MVLAQGLEGDVAHDDQVLSVGIIEYAFSYCLLGVTCEACRIQLAPGLSCAGRSLLKLVSPSLFFAEHVYENTPGGHSWVLDGSRLGQGASIEWK
jgi:hypothetical protein